MKTKTKFYMRAMYKKDCKMKNLLPKRPALPTTEPFSKLEVVLPTENFCQIQLTKLSILLEKPLVFMAVMMGWKHLSIVKNSPLVSDPVLHNQLDPLLETKDSQPRKPKLYPLQQLSNTSQLIDQA